MNHVLFEAVVHIIAVIGAVMFVIMLIQMAKGLSLDRETDKPEREN